MCEFQSYTESIYLNRLLDKFDESFIKAEFSRKKTYVIDQGLGTAAWSGSGKTIGKHGMHRIDKYMQKISSGPGNYSLYGSGGRVFHGESLHPGYLRLALSFKSLSCILFPSMKENNILKFPPEKEINIAKTTSPSNKKMDNSAGVAVKPYYFVFTIT